jgi:hypothetical protein
VLINDGLILRSMARDRRGVPDDGAGDATDQEFATQINVC